MALVNLVPENLNQQQPIRGGSINAFKEALKACCSASSTFDLPRVALYFKTMNIIPTFCVPETEIRCILYFWSLVNLNLFQGPVRFVTLSS